MRLLLIEDDVALGEGIHQALVREGYTVDWLQDGSSALHALLSETFDVVVLDLGLPRMDGLEVLRRLRDSGSNLPVLILTARDATEDRIAGLDAGADDYLVKPFEFPELLARVRTLLRRSEHIPLPDVLRVADLELDPRRHRAYRGSRRIDLTTKEFALLHVLMRQAGEVMTRTQIISLVWDMNFDCDTNVVEVSISRLRGKVDDQSEVKLIHTIRGVGYVLEARP